MATSLSHDQKRNLADLSQSLLRNTLVALCTMSWAIWYWQLAGGTWDLRLVAVPLAVTILTAVLAAGRSLPATAALWLQSGACFAGAFLCYVTFGCQVAALAFVLPVLLSGLALALVPAAVFTVAGCTVVALVPPTSSDWAVGAFLLVLLTGMLVVQQCHAVRQTLLQVWGLTASAVALANELSLRQEEVNRLNGALKTSNGLLKRNLRELALAQRDAEQARHLKEQFANTVSHELRTPLSIMLGYLEVMQRYPEVYGTVNWTSGLRHDINEIQASARYLSTLVDDLLDLARVQTLRMPLRRERCELAPIVGEAVELAERLLIGKRGVAIVTHVASDTPMVFVDRTRIRQVLINLLANACRFIESGEIRVSVATAPDEVVVTVADTGPGIAPEQLERIFGEFEQVAEAQPVQPGRSGKGLGLSIARSFMQMHGGRIWVESKLGVGSSFHFSIPLTNKQIVSLGETTTTATDERTAAPTVVVVATGDEVRFLSRHLESYRFVSAADWQHARGLVHELHPHAVIVSAAPGPSDAHDDVPPLRLPEPVPVVQCVLPGNRWARRAGAFDLRLTKPVDSDTLIEALAAFQPARRILLVDDDRSFVGLLRRILQARGDGCELAWAYSGEEALAKAARFEPDVVVMDIAMPGMGGFELAERMHQLPLTKMPAIIVLSAIQPEEEGSAAAQTFSVSYSPGLRESEVLALLTASLTHLRPGYLPLSPAAASAPTATATVAS